jgi:UTP--glucose-1-phosphate uridylyltransferase
MFDRIELHFELLDALRARPPGFLNGGRVVALALGFGNFVAGSTLLAPQALNFWNETSPDRFQGRDVPERLVGVQSTPAQASSYLLKTIADDGRIEHESSEWPELRPDAELTRSCSFTRARTILHSSRALLARPVFLCYDAGVRTNVRKAVFPAAGLGTRFLPATKAQPKEMLPLVDKPIIQYGVEEAVASGIDNIILVTGRGKNAIEDHFDRSVELESFLEARGKQDQLDDVRKISSMINVSYVRQGEPLGLGHAVLVARELVGDEPFAVILGDDVIDAEPPAIKQLIDVFQKVGGPVLAVERVPRDEISSYGVIAPGSSPSDGTYEVKDLVEKPPRDEAPSNLAIIGRYILTPDIFPALTATRKDRTGEIQLTNGLRELLKSRPIYACEVNGVRHDTGNKLGFLKAVVYFALRRPDLADKFSAYLMSLDLETPAVRR